MLRRTRFAVLVLTALTLTVWAGCLLDPSYWAGVGTGFALGRATTPVVTTQQCWENGVVVDCSQLPQ